MQASTRVVAPDSRHELVERTTLVPQQSFVELRVPAGWAAAGNYTVLFSVREQAHSVSTSFTYRFEVR